MPNFQDQVCIRPTSKQKVSSSQSIHRMDLSALHQIKTWRYGYMQAFSMPQSKLTVQGTPPHSIDAADYFLKDFRASKECLRAHRIKSSKGGDAAEAQCRNSYQPNR